MRLESSLPHLDRPFDYSVPAALDAAAQPGVRVKVKFNGQELAGYLIERVAESDAGHPLVPLHKVVSPVPVLTASVADLAGRVAARYAVNVTDFEVYHSAEGARGVLILLIEAAQGDLFRGGLIARGFRPSVRRLG